MTGYIENLKEWKLLELIEFGKVTGYKGQQRLTVSDIRNDKLEMEFKKKTINYDSTKTWNT